MSNLDPNEPLYWTRRAVEERHLAQSKKPKRATKPYDVYDDPRAWSSGAVPVPVQVGRRLTTIPDVRKQFRGREFSRSCGRADLFPDVRK